MDCVVVLISVSVMPQKTANYFNVDSVRISKIEVSVNLVVMLDMVIQFVFLKMIALADPGGRGGGGGG